MTASVESGEQGRGRFARLRWLGTVALVAVALLVLLGVGWLYARVLAPERRAAATAPVVEFDGGPMRRAVSPEAVAREQEAILALGSRYLGQPGMDAAERHVRAAFEAAGLEIHEQPVRAVTPRTAYREVYRGAERLADVEVYPLMPNHLQPVVTPPDGVEGELVLLDAKALATRRDFDGVIGLVDAGPGGVASDFGYHWARYAQLGVRALIVAHKDGLGAIDWNTLLAKKSGLVSSIPVNFARLAATPAIFEHVGERLRIRVRVDFVEHAHRTLYGVLRAKKKPATEAIVLYAPLDATAFVPDLAPGALPALNTAYLLQLARGLSATAGNLDRDVIFMASGSSVMAEQGLSQLVRVLQYNTFARRSNRLLDALEPTARDAPGRDASAAGAGVVEATRLAPIAEAEAQNEAQRKNAAAVLRAFAAPGFLADAAATRGAVAGFGAEARAFFSREFQHVLGAIVLERQEAALERKLAFERRARGDTRSREFAAYLAARRELDAANAIAGSQALALVEKSPAFVRSLGLRGRAEARFRELAAWHERRRLELAGDRAVAKLFSRYREFGVVRPMLAPSAGADPAATEVLSIHSQNVRETQSVELLLASAARRLGLAEPAFRVEPMSTSPSQPIVVESNTSPAPILWQEHLFWNGYMAMGLVNLQRQPAYQQWSSPEVLPYMRELGSLAASFASGGELLLYLAHGNGLLGGIQGFPWQRKSYGGRVLVSNVGQSVVPSFPLAGALIGARGVDREELHSLPGYWKHPFYRVDPYGRFDLPEQAADFGVWWRMYSDGYAFTPIAVGYGGDGLIAYMKDEGEEGQRLFKSINVPLTNERLIRDVSVVTFRAAPLAILDLTNPQDFKDYAEVQMIRPDGLTAFSKRCEYNGFGLVAVYLPPDQRAHALLKSGRPDNENVREIRAFLLNPKERAARAGAGDEIQGAGYLVADTPFLLRVPFEAAESMAGVNGRRLAVQERYGMADERTRDYHRKTLSLLSDAKKPELPVRDAALRARDAVSYAGLNHPVLRESVFEAVIGILWYLALLVPFVFFAEKLVFGFSDVRRQIAAQAVIFLIVFGLLRFLHPAFQMVRSSLMILLGFVIILISGGITLLFSGKAKENLAELRKRQGRVAAAEVDTLGVVASSFLVGLNNMQRRRVRTGLTCATLTLLTFVMICFTSTQNDVVEQTVTVGRAEYQGLLSKHDDFLPMTDSESFALKSAFSERFSVAERRFITGAQDWKERKKANARLTAVVQGKDGARRAPLSSVLKLSPAEPLRGAVRVLTKGGWLLPEHAAEDGKPVPILIPDRLADRLGVTKEAVDAGEVAIAINDIPFRIWGIFAADSLDGLRDLDGADILPFDIERVSSLTDTKYGYTVEADSPRIPAERVVIAPLRDLKLQGAVNGREAREVIASVAVDMRRSSLKTAREQIEAHLEKTAQPAFFGLEGVAYRGVRARELTLAGLLDLLVPLLLAGLTVLNTMKGSVYERRGEIYVYNAIGVSPRYVLVMFLAEAFVYVVIGSVLGYLLSQGVGRVLTELDLTGGLNMTFTSIATVYASLAIAAAVFVSTWFPARSAMDIAAPAEESGWKLPEPEGDVLAFDLPFNFQARGRLAVLAFFERWLAEHGEGSAGRFYASPPELGVSEEADPVTAGPVPEMRLEVWLKPFDLAVSQELVITTPHDPETGQFKARLALRRLSGTRESWLRLNHGFVAAVRRHFLHWRAVTESQREEMYVEARERLEAKYPAPSAEGAVA